MPPRTSGRRAARASGAGRGGGRRRARVDEEGSVHAESPHADRGDSAGENRDNGGPGNPFAREIAAAIAASLNQMPRASGSSRVLDAVREFRRSDPPKFDGEGGDFLKANHWLAAIRKAFHILDITEDDLKIRLVTGQLVGEAGEWWDSILESRKDERRAARVAVGQPREPDIENMTWAEFERTFEDQYFLESCREKLRNEFERFEQGDMTVSEYASKFIALARHAPEFVSKEDRKCRRFEKGLREGIRKYVVGLRINSYVDIVECARAIEDQEVVPTSNKVWEPRQVASGISSSSGSFESHGRKRQRESSQPAQSQRTVRQPASSGVQGSSSRSLIVCHKCKQPGHFRSQCPKRACFTCGRVDHIAADCPQGKGVSSVSDSGQQPRTEQSVRHPPSHQYTLGQDPHVEREGEFSIPHQGTE